ncbi:MAG TPA: PQQ-binding-like beta-propeller repeat protein [Pirellulales bacterium]|jgi:outer membrane protein assembly factor BamB|nr:PQQ-binding-like beta-propeller repeat protein [Pirellulales bacterium]
MRIQLAFCGHDGPLAPMWIALLAAWCACGCGQEHGRPDVVLSLPASAESAIASNPTISSAATFQPSAVPGEAADRTEPAVADLNWPGWRGENTSGLSASQHLPIEWTTEKCIRWKQPVPGRGNSSPVIWGDHVLITSALGEDEGSKLVVCALDRRSGAPQWQADAGTARGSKHNKNGYASASVVTDGQRVFASFGSAGLFAFDLDTGHPLWHADLGPLTHEWGSASSPVLVGQNVIQLCDSATESSLKAFDQRTGQPVWSTPRTSTGSWSTPVIIDAVDAAGQQRPELVVNGTGVDGSGSGFITAYDPADGHELWRVQGTTDVVCPTAIVCGGLVISTSGRNGPIIAIRPGGSGDVTASRIAWKYSRGGAYVPTGVALGNRLYLIADGGVMSCLNLASGEEVWRERLKGTFTPSLVAADGHIYATNEFGTVYVLAAGDKFQTLAANDMQERTLCTPAIAGDLFLRTETQLYCVAGGQQDDRSGQVSGNQ